MQRLANREIAARVAVVRLLREWGRECNERRAAEESAMQPDDTNMLRTVAYQTCETRNRAGEVDETQHSAIAP